MAEGHSTVINNTVYVGGKVTTADEFVIFSYDHSRQKWSSLPPLPVKYFGLIQVKGELVAVGGMKKGADVPTNEVYIYNTDPTNYMSRNTTIHSGVARNLGKGGLAICAKFLTTPPR